MPKVRPGTSFAALIAARSMSRKSTQVPSGRTPSRLTFKISTAGTSVEYQPHTSRSPRGKSFSTFEAHWLSCWSVRDVTGVCPNPEAGLTLDGAEEGHHRSHSPTTHRGRDVPCLRQLVLRRRQRIVVLSPAYGRPRCSSDPLAVVDVSDKVIEVCAVRPGCQQSVVYGGRCLVSVHLPTLEQRHTASRWVRRTRPRRGCSTVPGPLGAT